MKALTEDIPTKSLGRLKKDHQLTQYSMDELVAAFEGLTGESLQLLEDK